MFLCCIHRTLIRPSWTHMAEHWAGATGFYMWKHQVIPCTLFSLHTFYLATSFSSSAASPDSLSSYSWASSPPLDSTCWSAFYSAPSAHEALHLLQSQNLVVGLLGLWVTKNGDINQEYRENAPSRQSPMSKHSTSDRLEEELLKTLAHCRYPFPVIRSCCSQSHDTLTPRRRGFFWLVISSMLFLT